MQGFVENMCTRLGRFDFFRYKKKTRKIPQLDYGGNFEGDFTPNFCSPLRTGKVYIILILLQIFLYSSRSLLPKGVGSFYSLTFFIYEKVYL